MAFKFPVLKPKTIDCSGLPVHDFKCLTNKEIIGKGAYGAVFTANWQTVPDAGGKSAAAEKVVVKKLLGEDILDKKTFVITYVCISKLIVFQLLSTLISTSSVYSVVTVELSQLKFPKETKKLFELAGSK